MDPHCGRGRYGIVYASWFGRPGVGPAEIAVLCSLATFAHHQTGECWPHPATIAQSLGRTRTWALAALDRLSAAGLITRVRRRTGATGAWIYRLTGYGSDGHISPDPGAETAPSAAPAPSGPDLKSQSSDSQPCLPADTEQNQFSDSTSLSGASPPAPPTLNDWQPSPADLAYANTQRPDLTDLTIITEKFRQSSRAQGRHHRDISAAWRLWLLRERKTCHHVSSSPFFGPGSPQPQIPAQISPQRQNRQPRQPRPRHSTSNAVIGEPAAIATSNRVAAHACLERVLARRSLNSADGRGHQRD